MASPHVVPPALLLPIPVLALASSLYNARSHSSTPLNAAVPVLLAIFAAVAAGSAFGHAAPLRAVSRAFTHLLDAALSAVSVYALSPSSLPPAFPPPFLRFFLSLAALLLACELVSALIPSGPLLLPAILALISRGILLSLAIGTAISSLRRATTAVSDMDKVFTSPDSSAKTPGRVSSPTPGTWPFPGSLALQGQPKHTSCPANYSNAVDLPPLLTLAPPPNVHEGHPRNSPLLPLVFATAQIFATVCAALNVAASILADRSIIPANSPLSHILIACAVCTLLWSVAVLVIIQMLPPKPRPYSSDLEKQDAISCEHGQIQGDSDKIACDNPAPRTPKPSLSRRESDSAFDFLSLHDPFASSPPLPPPLPPVGLGLDEVDVGWNGSKEIGVQYRFPAPRSIVKGGKRKGKKARSGGKKRLVHQDSARTLLPDPPHPKTRGTEADVERDRGFGDEARLAHLLLQSLTEGEDYTPTTPTIRTPQAAHIPQSSRWSASTTVRSTMSASISNKSGVSTYMTSASEKVQANRISMNTIASVLGGRKSSEARRKSGTAASSSKG